MNPMRFYLVFDVEGNASQELSRLSSQFIELGSAATSASGGVQSFHGTVIAAIHGLRQLEEVGHGATAMGYGLVNVLGQLSGVVLQNAQEFQSLEARMGFAFGERSAAVWENAQEYAVESVYQFNEVAGVVGRLGIAIPGVAEEFANLPRSYLSRSGQMIDSLHVLGDTASGTARSFQMVSYEVMQMMAGVWRGAHQVLHLTHQETDAIKHSIQSTTDTAVQFSSIMQVLAAHYGGATSSMSHTLEFLRLQLPDIAQVIAARIGRGGLQYIAQAVKELVDYLRDLAKEGNPAVNALAQGFSMVAQYGASAVRTMIGVARSIEGFIGRHPEIVKISIAVAAVSGALFILGGTILSVTAGLGVFVASMTLAGGAIFSVMGMTTLAVAGVTAAFGGLIAVGVMFRHAYENNLGGIATRFNQIKLIVTALSEAIQNWHGEMTYISLDTGAKLQNAGILDFFVNMVSWIQRAREWWTGFVAGMESGLSRVNWGGVVGALGSIERSLAMIGVSLNLLSPAADTTFETMHERGFSFANLINNALIPALNMLIDLFRASAWAVENLIIPGIFRAGEGVKYLLNNWEAVKGTLFLVAAVLYPIPALIFGMVSATDSWGIAARGLVETFQVVRAIVQTIGNIMEAVGLATNSVGRGFVPPDSIPRPATPSYVSHVNRTLDDDEDRDFNPFRHGGPSYVTDTGGARTEQSPIQIQMARAGGGNLTPTGNLGGQNIDDLITALRDNTAATQRNSVHTPTGGTVPGPYAPPREPDYEREIETSMERRGVVPYLPR